MPPNYEALRATPTALAPHQRRWAWALAAAIVVPGLGVGVWAATESGLEELLRHGRARRPDRRRGSPALRR